MISSLFQDTDTLMLMKLANPEQFSLAYFESSETMVFEFIGFIEDCIRVDYFPGALYHNDKYFFAAFVLHLPDEPLSHRGDDDNNYEENPWVLYITGEYVNTGAFLRFVSREAIIKWLTSIDGKLTEEQDWYWIY